MLLAFVRDRLPRGAGPATGPAALGRGRRDRGRRGVGLRLGRRGDAERASPAHRGGERRASGGACCTWPRRARVTRRAVGARCPRARPFSGELARILFDREGESVARRQPPPAEVRDRYVGGGWAARREAGCRRRDARPGRRAARELRGRARDRGDRAWAATCPGGPAAPATLGSEPAACRSAGVAARAALERRRWSYSAVAGGAARRRRRRRLRRRADSTRPARTQARSASCATTSPAAFGGLAGTGLGVLIHGALEDAVGAARRRRRRRRGEAGARRARGDAAGPARVHAC